MKEKVQGIVFVTEPKFQFNTETKHQLSSLISRLSYRFPNLFKSNKWVDYKFLPYTDLQHSVKSKLIICLGNEAYHYTVKLNPNLPIIKITYIKQPRLRCRVLDRTDRIRSNLRITEIVNEIDNQLINYNEPLYI
jgi:hypothetical protein